MTSKHTNTFSVGPIESPGSLTQLAITDDISIGGYKDIILPASGVTKQGFEGCIEDVQLQQSTWDLNTNRQAKGVSPGCPEQVARVATFSASKLSYVAKPSESIGNNFDITFKMKTKQDQALLMYAGHTEQVNTFEPRHEKTNILVSDLVRHKPGYSGTEDG